jgi:hypothetical protein
MTGSTKSPAHRRMRWLAAAAIAMGMGAGIITGNGVASADEGTASNGINADASSPPANSLPGPISVLSPVATALQPHGVAIPPTGFHDLDQIGQTASSTVPKRDRVRDTLQDVLRKLSEIKVQI